MPQQIINLGATGSGAGGDSARTAFEKAIANFAELYPAALPGTAAQKAAARDMFGLGTAATRAVQTGPTDTATGALMAVGAFGLGSRSAVAPSEDLNLITASGFYAINTVTTNVPAVSSGSMCVHCEYSSGFAQQIVINRSSDRIFFRRQSGGTWLGWQEVLNRGVILGTVSRAGGVPTGAIIERGSNANGEYVRFADGTQICTFIKTFIYTTGNAIGPLFRSAANNVAGTWAAAFSSTPTTSFRVAMNSGDADRNFDIWASMGSSDDSTTAYSAVIISAVNRTSTVRIHGTAIGRWY